MKKNQLFLTILLISSNFIQAATLVNELGSLRSYNGKSIKAFIGFVDLIDGAESLIKNQDNNPMLGLQRLTEGVTSLIEARISDLPIDAAEQLNLVLIINEFKDQISDLVTSKQVKLPLDASMNSDAERKKLMEGLAAILYNAVYMLIDPKSMSACLTNILNGVYKVVAAILADDKIDYTDWRALLDALASIFNLSNVRFAACSDHVIKIGS